MLRGGRIKQILLQCSFLTSCGVLHLLMSCLQEDLVLIILPQLITSCTSAQRCSAGFHLPSMDEKGRRSDRSQCDGGAQSSLNISTPKHRGTFEDGSNL